MAGAVREIGVARGIFNIARAGIAQITIVIQKNLCDSVECLSVTRKCSDAVTLEIEKT